MSAAGDASVAVLVGGAVLAAVVSVVGGRRRDPKLVRLGLWALVAAAVAGAVATVVLGWALVTSDFTLAYVVEQSRRAGSGAYRLAGLWGGMEGSLLLWTAMLAGVGVVAAGLVRRPAVSPTVLPFTAAVQATAAAVVAGFGLVLAAVADPFVALPAPEIDGRGLTPILEHPAMLYHPPLLYAGLTSLLAPFALTMGSAAVSRLDRRWLARAQRWALVPWVLLGVGMVAGAHWAYVEVGWGGFWAWDPVENTALLPWLALTGFLHAALADESGRRDAPVSMAGPVLVAAGFVVAVLGTMLTRSGATQSVHAFAEDPAVGWALAGMVAATAGAAAVVLGRAARRRAREAVEARPARSAWRRRLLWTNAALAAAALVVVLVGTVYPLGGTLLGRDDVAAVDGAFFTAFVGPLALVALALSAVAPRLSGPKGLRLGLPAVAGAVALVAAWLAGWRAPFALAVAAVGGLAVAAALVDVVRRREHRAAHLAHLGFAVLMVGVAGSTTGTTVDATVAAGGQVSAGPYEVRNLGARVVSDPGDDVQRVAAAVTVLRGGRVVAELVPEVRLYRDRGERLEETATWSAPLTDVQVAVRDAGDDGRALLRVHVRPLQVWVWWGGLLLVVAGAWAFVARMRRARAPTPAREPDLVAMAP